MTLILDGGKGAAAVLIARAVAGEDAAQIAGWLAGALWLSAPFNLLWKLGNGNLGHNILITVASAAAVAPSGSSKVTSACLPSLYVSLNEVPPGLPHR